VQAEKSIRLLEELGFVKKIGPSKWKQTSTIVSTGPELRSVIVHNYHKSLLELSKEVMDRLTSKDRDTSALTLGMKKSRISEIREKIRRFRQELLEMISEDIEPEEVVQLNIQFFPVTKL
jgi:uncharacterized protein (TIGR02147 family)